MANTSFLRPIETAKRDTKQVEIANAPELRQDINKPPLSLASAPWKIALSIGLEPAINVTVEVAQQIMIGRADVVDSFTPGLDLGLYGGQDGGVSRRHALLLITNNGLYIRDLASTNGTRLNGFALKPNEPYKLKEGDRLEFGALHVTLQTISNGAVSAARSS